MRLLYYYSYYSMLGTAERCISLIETLRGMHSTVDVCYIPFISVVFLEGVEVIEKSTEIDTWHIAIVQLI